MIVSTCRIGIHRGCLKRVGVSQSIVFECFQRRSVDLPFAPHESQVNGDLRSIQPVFCRAVRRVPTLLKGTSELTDHALLA